MPVLSDKAARVIPNKVFQVLAAGAPLITRDSPAIRELVDDETPGVYLVPPGDPAALAAAVRRFAAERGDMAGLYCALNARFSPSAIGQELLSLVRAIA